MQAPQIKQNRIRIAARKELLEQNRLRNGFERKLVRQLQSGFKATGRLARKEYEQLGRLVETGRQSERKLRDVLESHYRAVIDAFGTRVLRNRKQDSQFEILIREYMSTVGGTRITQINNTTMKAINKVISKGAVEGLGVQAIGKNIFDKMDGSFSKLRSQTISRTETHSAASYANDRVNASLGIPNQIKRWVSVADARTRSWHVALNGTEVGKDEPFTVTVKGISYKMDYTGDPKGGAVNTINCRCVTLYLDPDDVIVDQPETIVEEPPTGIVLDITAVLSNVKTNALKKKFNDKLNNGLTEKQKQIVKNARLPSEIINSKKGVYYARNESIKSGTTGVTLEHEYGHHIDRVYNKGLVNDHRGLAFRSLEDKEFQLAFVQDAELLGLGEKGIDLDKIVGHRLKEGYSEKLKDLHTFLFKQEIVKKRVYTYKRDVPKFDGYSSISDIIDAMTSGTAYSSHGFWGHGKKYFQRKGSKYKETFANLFAIYNRPEVWAEAKRLFPNTTREFERLLDELVEEKNRNSIKKETHDR